MKGDILEGHFLLEPSKNPLGECTIQAMNFAFAIVQIKMEDNCWYQVMLQKSGKDDEWCIGFLDILMKDEKSMGYYHLPLQKRRELVEKIINHNQFRLHFLFV